MSAIVNITVMGMIAFVPGPAGDGLTAIVPDLTQRYTASDGSIVPSHRALLVFRCSDLAAGCSSSDLDAVALSAVYQTWDDADFLPGVWGARRLDGMELKIAPQLPEIPDDIQIDDVPHLKDFATNNSVIDSQFLLDVNAFKAATPYSAATAARITLAKGVKARVNGWVTRSFVKITTGFAPFGSNSSVHPQLLADMTTASVAVGSGATVSFTPFRQNGTAQNPLQLNLGGANPVQLYILNLAVCDQWTGVTGGTKLCSEDRTHEGTHHFEYYYELSQTRPLYRNRFVPASVPPPAALTHDRPICPPAMFVRQ